MGSRGGVCRREEVWGGVVPTVTMAPRGMVVTAILLSLMVMACVEVPVTAQEPPPSPAPAPATPSPPITCTLPNTSMVSRNACNYNDEQSMEQQISGCTGYLTEYEPVPSAACCKGFNEVAYNRTACICMATFYPTSGHNASRQLDLPRLCNVRTNLCGQCPTFLVSRSNGSSASPNIAGVPYSEGKSTASTVGAITLAVVFGLLLVAGIIAGSIMVIKKRRAKNNPPGPFEAAPPGGSF